MIPIKQRIIDNKKGDCFTACIASLLEIPYEDIPDIPLWGWMEVVSPFLRKNGFTYEGYQKPEKAIELSVGIDGFYIVDVPSQNFEGIFHSVIFKGLDFVFDPSTAKTKDWKPSDCGGFHMIERWQGEQE